ncbi:MAG: accessory gene regulator ArgB-like protein [Acidobacteriota bacterium]
MQADAEKTEVIAYGAEILYGAIFKFVVIVGLALLTSSLWTTCISFVAYAGFRLFGGGVHAQAYWKCLTIGTIMLVGMGNLAKFAVGSTILVLLALFALFLGLWTIIVWVPAGTEKKTVTDFETRNRIKMQAVFFMTGWAIITLTLTLLRLNNYALASILGVLGAQFMVTPWGYRTIEVLDNILSGLERRC